MNTRSKSRRFLGGGAALIAMALLLVGLSVATSMSPAGAWPAPSTTVTGTACEGGVRPTPVTFTIENNETGYPGDPGRISNVTLVGDPTSLDIPSTLTFTPNPLPNTGDAKATASFDLDPNYQGELKLRYKFSWNGDPDGHTMVFKVNVAKCVEVTTTTSTTEPPTTTTTEPPTTTTSTVVTTTSTSTTQPTTTTTEPPTTTTTSTSTTSTTQPTTTTTEPPTTTTSTSTTSTTEPTTTSTTEPETTTTTRPETTTTTRVETTVPTTVGTTPPTTPEAPPTTVCEETSTTGNPTDSRVECETVAGIIPPAVLERLPVTGSVNHGWMMVLAGLLLGGGLVMLLAARETKTA